MQIGLINGQHPAELTAGIGATANGGPSPAEEGAPPPTRSRTGGNFHWPMIAFVIGAILVLILLRLMGLTFVGSASAGLKVQP